MAQTSVGQFKLWLGVMGVASLVLSLFIEPIKWLALFAMGIAFMALAYRNRTVILSRDIFLFDFTDILFFLTCVTAIFFIFTTNHWSEKILYVFVAFMATLLRKMQSRQPILSELF